MVKFRFSYQCRVACNVGIYPFASQGYNVSHAISASPPLMDFPAGYFAVVGGGGGGLAGGPGEEMVVQTIFYSLLLFSTISTAS